MISNMIPLVASWLPFWREFMIPIFALAVVGFAGRFVIYLFRR